jgi:hypothetical protein
MVCGAGAAVTKNMASQANVPCSHGSQAFSMQEFVAVASMPATLAALGSIRRRENMRKLEELDF